MWVRCVCVKGGEGEILKAKRSTGDKEELDSKARGASGEGSSSEASTVSGSPKNAKVQARSKPEYSKQDYIHVRARRGQATDSHSLAERVRREKISERMKFLQDLVPGCKKVTGKAVMLDEIINYVQSLQRQVEVRLTLPFLAPCHLQNCTFGWCSNCQIPVFNTLPLHHHNAV